MNRWKYGAAALGLMSTVIFSPVASASEFIDINLNGSFLFEGDMPISNIAIANPAVADIVRPSGFDSQVLIVGMAPGSTTLFVWYEDGTVLEYTVNVGIDDEGQARAIQRVIGLPRVRVQVVAGGTGGGRKILLRGTVRNQAEHDMAMKVASLYTSDAQEKEQNTSSGSTSGLEGITDGGDFEYDFDYRSNRVYPNIIDLLTIENPSQIRLEAQLIEISSDDAKDIGLKYAGTDSTGAISFSTIGQFYGGESYEGNHNSWFWPWNHFSKINASLNLLIQQGRAKVLSRPSVSTMSGAKARIFIGGQIPVPVSNGNGSESIEWKDYGIRLHIRPTTEEDGTITAEVHAGVSRLDESNTVVTSSTTIPAVTAREAHSIVHLNNGATMVVGGLLNSEDIKTISKVPILSSIPILGEFFKHRETSTERRELLILITPIIVDENTPARMSDKMQEYYNKQREEARARNDVDLNRDRKEDEAVIAERAEAEKAERDRREWEEEQKAIAAEWRARENNVPRVKPGNAWVRTVLPDAEEVARVAAEAAGQDMPAEPLVEEPITDDASVAAETVEESLPAAQG